MIWEESICVGKVWQLVKQIVCHMFCFGDRNRFIRKWCLYSGGVHAVCNVALQEADPAFYFLAVYRCICRPAFFGVLAASAGGIRFSADV